MSDIWSLYSKKLIDRIERPRNVGYFTVEDARAGQMVLMEGRAGSIATGDLMRIYCLVDPEDGLIADAKFQVFGPSWLIGALDAACDLLIRRSSRQALKIDIRAIDQHLRDRVSISAFPDQVRSYLSPVKEAIVDAVGSGDQLPAKSPLPPQDNLEEWMADFEELSIDEKMRIIESVLDEDIRPFVAMDGGGVDALRLEGSELVIAYKGACASCFAAAGATLAYITKTIRHKVHPSLTVRPELKDFSSKKGVDFS